MPNATGTIYDRHPDQNFRLMVLKQRRLLGKLTQVNFECQKHYSQTGKVPDFLEKAVKKAEREYEAHTQELDAYKKEKFDKGLELEKCWVASHGYFDALCGDKEGFNHVLEEYGEWVLTWYYTGYNDALANNFHLQKQKEQTK